MFKDLFSNRLFIGALAIFIFCVGGSLLYMQHVTQKGEKERAETQARVAEWNEKQKPITEVSQVSETPQGHFHEDGTFHAEPHEAIAAPAEVSVSEVSTEVSTAPQTEYNTGAGNPHPWEHVPVDLWDFEATKASMIENFNFFKANWDPKVYNREVSIASAIVENIDNAARATDLGLYTPEQAAEIHAVHARFYEFQGIDSGRTSRLMDEGYTRDEARRIATDELLERWGVK